MQVASNVDSAVWAENKFEMHEWQSCDCKFVVTAQNQEGIERDQFSKLMFSREIIA